ncbi:MAG: amino acid ABC transporter ATP-binding protein [Firmicutes bacterium]|nr:amino acid ABC transporter ATP-binding protein [Bacillota bacterium]
MAYLTIENFNKSFGKTAVLKGIDFTMERGEVVSIIGSSGSGKTTLLRCINFLETPDSGIMTLDGERLFDSQSDKKETESSLREKRLNFGLVFQSFNLFPQYKVLKNIMLAPMLMLGERCRKYKNRLTVKALEDMLKIKSKRAERDVKLDNFVLETVGGKAGDKLTIKTVNELIKGYRSREKDRIASEALELLEKIGLSDKKDNYPCELSGGQCQRVAIARALALSPKILCFDEPTSALDPELTGEVLKVIKSLKGDNRTMLIVTHEMEFAKNVSDKVIFMADGVVEEMGRPNQIFEKPKSEKLKNFLYKAENKEQEND